MHLKRLLLSLAATAALAVGVSSVYAVPDVCPETGEWTKFGFKSGSETIRLDDEIVWLVWGGEGDTANNQVCAIGLPDCWALEVCVKSGGGSGGELAKTVLLLLTSDSYCGISLSGQDISHISYRAFELEDCEKPPAGTLSGVKFCDKNGDGFQDPGEEGLAGWTIYATFGEDGVISTETGSDGSWSLGPFLVGTEVTVCEELQEGWFQTAPEDGCYVVTVEVGGVPSLDFGNQAGKEVCLYKFYDANANGTKDEGETLIPGWQFAIGDEVYTTGADGYVCVPLVPGTYEIIELLPDGSWVTTTDPVTLEIEADCTLGLETVEIGNVCLGAGGGNTLGFWSNKNGQAKMNDDGSLEPELAMLRALNLRNGSGADFDPTTYAGFRSWLLAATADYMPYMLSAQLAAMALNVEAGFVGASALVYEPCSDAFVSIADLMSEANTALFDPSTTTREYQECLKNALDDANNNLNFVQASPCEFSYSLE